MTLNALTIDVEDYFQVSAFEKVSPVSEWDSFQLRVQSNTEKILDSLSEKGLVATFFVLGWVAQRCPELIKKIAAQGHEIASQKTFLAVKNCLRISVGRKLLVIEPPAIRSRLKQIGLSVNWLMPATTMTPAFFLFGTIFMD